MYQGRESGISSGTKAFAAYENRYAQNTTRQRTNTRVRQERQAVLLRRKDVIRQKQRAGSRIDYRLGGAKDTLGVQSRICQEVERQIAAFAGNVTQIDVLL